MEPKNELFYGSCVVLENAELKNYFIQSEGFADNSIKMVEYDSSNPSGDFSKCVFRILPPSQYSTQKTIVQSYPTNSRTETNLAKLDALCESLESELKTNADTFSKYEDKNVEFTSMIQLQHVCSEKYLALKKNEIAEFERDNLKLVLEDLVVDDYCYFEIAPAYEYQKTDGRRAIYANETVYISTVQLNKNKKGTTAYIHQSEITYSHLQKYDNPSIGSSPVHTIRRKTIVRKQTEKNLQKYGEGIEVNASLDKRTKLRIKLFSPHIGDPEIISCGDIIWLYLSESRAILTGKENKAFSSFEYPNINEWANSASDIDRRENIDDSFEDEEMRVLLERNCEPQMSDTHGMWIIENPDYRQGGPINWDTFYRIKHINSQLYLTVQFYSQSDAPFQRGSKDNQRYRLTLSEKLSSSTLFRFENIYSRYIKNDSTQSSYNMIQIKNNHFIKIQHVKTGLWLKCDDILSGHSLSSPFDDDFRYAMDSINPEDDIFSGNLLYPKLSKDDTGSDIYRVIKANQMEVFESYFLNSCIPVLFSAAEVLSPVKITYNSLEMLKDSQTKFSIYKNKLMIKKALKDLQDFLEISEYDEVNDASLLGHRQKILREHKCFEALVLVLNTTFPDEKELEKIGELKEQIKKSSSERVESFEGFKRRKSIYLGGDSIIPSRTPSKVDLSSILKSSSEMENVKRNLDISKKVYELIKNMCKNNHENEHYAFRFIDTFVKQCKYISEAIICIQSLIQNNEWLLTSIAVTTPRSTSKVHKSFSYIQNKTNILQKMFLEHKRDIVVPRKHFLEFLSSVAKFQNVGITSNQELIFHLLFDDEFTKTIILLDIKTENNKVLFYSKEKQKFYPISSLTNAHPQSEVEYLRSQLDLFSDLCMGRNYICMNYIKSKCFPLQQLCELVWLKDVPEILRAALCKLLQYLYIDDEPFIKIKRPQLCRIFSSAQNLEKQTQFRTESIAGIEPTNATQQSIKEKKSFLDLVEEEKETSFRNQNLYRRTYTRFSFNIKNKRKILKQSTSESVSHHQNKDEKTREQYNQLKTKILDYFRQHVLPSEDSDLKWSILTLEVVKLCKAMIEFGLFGDLSVQKPEGEINQLIIYLFTMLRYNENSGSKYLIQKRGGRVEHSSMKREHSLHNSSIPSPFLGSNQTSMKRANLIESIGEKLSKHLVRSGMSPNIRSHLSKAFIKENQRIQELTKPEIEIKIEICQIFHYLLGIRQDFLLVNTIYYFNYKIFQFINSNRQTISLLKFFEENSKKKLSFMPSIMRIGINAIDKDNNEAMKIFSKMEASDQAKNAEVDEESPVDDLDTILGKPLLPVLFRLFYSASDFRLKDLGFLLIRRCFSQRKELIESISKMQLLFKNEDIRLFGFLTDHVNKLRTLVETSELWLPSSTQEKEKMNSSESKIDNMISIIKQLNQILYTNTEFDKDQVIVIPTKYPKIDRNRQKLYNYLEVDINIIDFFKDNGYKLPSLQQLIKEEQIRKIFKLFRAMNVLLASFVKNNLKNQKKVGKQLKLLTKNLKINVGQISLICELFRNNMKLCTNVSESFLKMFVNLINSEGRQARFLDIFLVVQKFKDMYLPETQRRVLNVILNSPKRDTILFMEQSEKYGFPIFTFKPRSPPFRNPNYLDEPYLYHKKILEVLKTSGSGINQLYICEAKCQKAFPLNYIFNVLSGKEASFLENEQMAYEVKLELLEFFYHIYLDTEKTVEQLYFNRNLSEFINYEKSKLIQMDCYNPYFPTYCSYLFEHLLPIIGGCFKLFGTKMEDKDIFERDDVSSIDEFCKVFFNQHLKFMQYIQSSRARRNFNEFKSKFKNLYQELVKKNPLLKLSDLNINFSDFKILDKDNAENSDSYSSGEQEFRSIGSESIEDRNYFKASENLSESEIDEDEFRERNDIIKRKESQDSEASYGDNEYLAQALKEPLVKNVEMTAISTPNFHNMGEYWGIFVKSLQSSDNLKHLVYEEAHTLLMGIRNISEIVEMKELITFEQIIQTIIKFLLISYKQFNQKDTTVAIISILSSLIEKCQDENHTMRMQNTLIKMGAIDVVFNLFCEKNIHNNNLIFNNLLNFSNNLLSGGNFNSQKCFYNFFKENSSSEFFFETIYNILTEEIERNNDSDENQKEDQKDSEVLRMKTMISHQHTYVSQVEEEKNLTIPYSHQVDKTRDEKVDQILIFLQHLTENHNSKLQNYLRYQKSSHINYDLVNTCVKYLTSLNLVPTKQNYSKMMLCLETLTEFIQGPCVENQLALIEAKFLNCANEILGIGFEETGVIRKERGKFNRSGFTKRVIRHNEEDSLEEWMVARLKYNCSVTLISLLEGSKDSLSSIDIRSKMIKMLSEEILLCNIKDVYLRYLKLYKNCYCSQAFNHYEPDPERNIHNYRAQYYTTIIEVGFNLFHVLIRLIHNQSSYEISQRYEKIEEILDWHENETVNTNSKGILLKTSKNNSFGGDDEEMSFEGPNGTDLINAILFFKNYSAEIEVSRNETVEKAFFPIPPHCKYLSKELRNNFKNNINRSSRKTKITSLIDYSPILIQQMKWNMTITQFFQKSVILALLQKNQELYKDCSFILCIVLNLIVLLSYSIYSENYRDSPQLFYLLNTHTTKLIITVLGITQTIFSLLVLLFVIMKEGPACIADASLKKKPYKQKETMQPTAFEMFLKEGGEKPKKKKLKKSVAKVERISNIGIAICAVLTEWRILFYLLYVIFSILGTWKHPFFFSFHLCDFLIRFPVLQNVAKAVWRPRHQLLLTLCFYLILNYIFTVLAYYYFNDQLNEHCTSVLKCFFTIFDQTFKNDGAVGGFMEDKYEGNTNSSNINITRLLFDNVFYIFQTIIMINIVAGIIIDTFAVLRHEAEETKKDKENICLICGNDRETLDKNLEHNKGFQYHIKHIHNMWNYVFYISYIKEKTPTDYTGIEYYVAEKMVNGDIMWVPCFIEQNDTSAPDHEKNHQKDEFIFLKNQIALLAERGFMATGRNSRGKEERSSVWFDTKKASIHSRKTSDLELITPK